MIAQEQNRNSFYFHLYKCIIFFFFLFISLFNSPFIRRRQYFVIALLFSRRHTGRDI